ncbi:EF-hand calcium-binding domain-containing protein 13 [Octodon degus]|uniref:EF-hand calcium-binding domain-containing protein 13 n=1 Tax=Octodon degus TaxID=10160 RepID=A0A6P6ECT4_OCTDE|nr:EF-hand calcium-binding domain-containing protein 13 [Octodon degus]
METKARLFFQAEENIDLSDKGSDSFTTILPSRNTENKKYIKFSKTIEKKISSEVKDLSTEYKKDCNEMPEQQTCKEEQFFWGAYISGGSSPMSSGSLLWASCEAVILSGARGRACRSLQRQVAPPTVRLPKEVARKENILCKLPNQYNLPKASSPLHKPSIFRKKEKLSNLDLTLYEEMPQGYLYSQELSALHKACKIFSKIRNGKIYVNDLPLVLSILKISISDSEMRQILKIVDVDVFQDNLKIFGSIKDGRVATDEVVDILDSMGIPITSETFQDVINNTYVDSKHMVDIGDIVFILDALQGQYEDIYSDLDETASKKRLPKVEGYSLQYKKKYSLPSRLTGSSMSKKLIKKIPQYPRKIMEENDSEIQPSKNFEQIRKFPGEPYAKSGMNFKKHSEKAENYDSKSKLPNLKSTTSVNKSLDKNGISNIPKLENLVVRKDATLLKHVSSKEKTAVNTLENVCDAISKLQENSIAPEELQHILPSLGITLLDEDLQEIMTETTRNESGMVNLEDFMKALCKEQSLSEYDVLTDVIKAIDKIKDENVDSEDLKTCLQNLGIYLSKPELEKVRELTKADETQKVNFKDFVNTMLSNTESFSEKLSLPATIENLHNIIKEQIGVSDLWNTLSSLNNNLKKDEFLTALKLATIGEGDKVEFEEFAKGVKNMYDTSRLGELEEIALALDSLEGNMIAETNLEDFLRNVGIKSPEEAIENIHSNFVNEDDMVNVKDCMEALKDTQKFSNFIALNKTISTLNLMEECDQSDEEKYRDVLENADRHFATDDLQIIKDGSVVEEISTYTPKY